MYIIKMSGLVAAKAKLSVIESLNEHGNVS